MQNHKRFYIISFFEGAAVMAAEICSAKLLAPYFGSSLYVWSSVMAITLAGLASGYFFGGKLSLSQNKRLVLIWVLCLASLYLIALSFLSGSLHVIASIFSLIPAVVVSSLILIFPVMFLMGTASPLIISILTNNHEKSGEISGQIYAISTLGGIVATFLSGFYLIPNYGIMPTLFVFSIGLFISVISLFQKNGSKLCLLILFIAASSLSFSFTQNHHTNSIYYQEGMLGIVEVIDEPLASNPNVIIRKLLVNNVIQTEMNVNSGKSNSDYIALIQKNISLLPDGNALILGLGGGLVANQFINHQYKVTGVEFDQRIIDCAYNLFGMDERVKSICDDARHFLNITKDTYNTVLIDLFKAEEQPSHVLTIESLTDLKHHLDTNAIVIVNTHGYLYKECGLGTQCLINTFKKAGYDVKICVTGTNEDYRNTILLASVKPFRVTFHQELYPIVIENPELINSDQKPILEKLNAEANLLWRKNYLTNYILRK